MKTKRESHPSGIVRCGGVTFFWALNDQCGRASLRGQLLAFQRAGVEALVLHPRCGLLLPYGSEEWFATIRWLVGECHRRGIEPILYDEDPYPSGNAGGRIVAEHPETTGHAIERHAAPEELREGELFVFPSGRLCWAGIVFPEAPGKKPVGLSARVGMIRRHWEKAEWDSRWYYPATPVYPHPRAIAHHAEFALPVPKVPAGGKLLAYVARPVESCTGWGRLVDTLNPEVTRLFLEYTHERYARTLGSELGRSVRAIFTDEAKPHSEHPWTPGMFEAFRREYGYDLRPRLEALFSTGDACPRDMKTRIDFRRWVTRRFDQAWMRPVSRWCARHGLALIGHLSPEEDPVNQSATIGNLFPLQKKLSLGGFDLIIPAIGDRRHPLLNVAAISANSSAQQNRKPGVCCESLGAFGTDVTARGIARVLAWQALNGVSLAVLHAAFHSQLGLRRMEAPPDYGPQSPLWESVRRLYRELTPFFRAAANASQEAPVAILWPIRSFQAKGDIWQGENNGPRRELLDLLSLCLEHQVGVHFLDEDDLARAEIRRKPGPRLTLGKAAYEWILVPSMTTLGGDTFAALKKMAAAGVRVLGAGAQPAWKYSKKAAALRPAKPAWPSFDTAAFRARGVSTLPRLFTLPEEDRKHFQVTVWRKAGRREMFVMHVGEHSRAVEISGERIRFDAGELIRFREARGTWRIHARFSPAGYPNGVRARDTVSFGRWEMRVSGRPPVEATHPMGAWQLVPHGGRRNVNMVLTSTMRIDGGGVADSITYRVKAKLPPHSRKPVLCIEPTLMRGNFTLRAGEGKWRFRVRDTDSGIRKIDLSKVRRNGSLDLTFVLHHPEAPDGIKDHPLIEVGES